MCRAGHNTTVRSFLADSGRAIGRMCGMLMPPPPPPNYPHVGLRSSLEIFTGETRRIGHCGMSAVFIAETSFTPLIVSVFLLLLPLPQVLNHIRPFFGNVAA